MNITSGVMVVESPVESPVPGSGLYELTASSSSPASYDPPADPFEIKKLVHSAFDPSPWIPFDGATAAISGDLVTGSGLILVLNGGNASGLTVEGGYEVVDPLDYYSFYHYGPPLFGSAYVVLDTYMSAGSATDFNAVVEGTADSFGVQNLCNGGTAINTDINAGGIQYVRDASSALSATVNSNGAQYVSAGGEAIGTRVNRGGTAIVTLDGEELSATISGSGSVSGLLEVSAGGTAVAIQILGGGKAIVFQGGTTVSASVIGSGPANSAVEVLSEGTAFATFVSSTGKLSVRSGGEAVDTLVSDTIVGSSGNGGLLVSSGGRATDTIINSGGLEVVSSGAEDHGATVSAGGQLLVSAGGTTSSATVLGDSATSGLELLSGGLSIETTVSWGGKEIVFSSGVASATSLSDTGKLIVSAGGLASDTIVDSTGLSSGGGGLLIRFGGSATDTEISDGGREVVSSGGVDLGATVSDGGWQMVESGTAIDATILSGGSQLLSDGVESGSLIESGAIQYDGGIALDTIVSGGTQFVGGNGPLTSVFVSGTAVATTVEAGGFQKVHSASTAIGAAISSGGNQYVSSGAGAVDTTVSAGGAQIVYVGGTASSTSAAGDASSPIGAALVILSGGTSSNATIANGAQLIVSAGSDDQQNLVSGLALNTQVTSGGLIYVSSGGMNISATISAGGEEVVYTGGSTSGDSIAGTAGTSALEVLRGGTSYGAVVSDGGQLIATIDLTGGGGAGSLTPFTLTSGTANNTVVSSGGQFDVTGGVASATIISNGGELDISAGVASDTILSSGAYAYVYSGGSAVNTTVESGGFLYVYSGGIESGTTIESGGTVIVEDGSLAGSELDDGTLIFNLTGSDTFSGTLSGNDEVIVEGSGTLVMSGGDAFTGDVVLSGGTLELTSATAVGSAAITFTSGIDSELKIDGTTMPTNVISSFSPGDPNIIHLKDVAFDPHGYTLLQADGSGPNGSDILHVIEQGTDYKLNIDPIAEGGFVLSKDSAGSGTDITFDNEWVPGGPVIGTPIAGSTPPTQTAYSDLPNLPVNPYGAVARIAFGNGGQGTGFIIDQHTILTAAHVVEDQVGSIHPVKVFLGDNGQSISIMADQIDVGTLDYESEPGNDWAVIDVPNLNLEQLYGSFTIATDFAGGFANVTGYPGHPYGGSILNVNQYSAFVQASTGYSTTGAYSYISYTPLATAKGDSGGPVWVFNGASALAVGIHTKSGSGILLTPNLETQISLAELQFETIGPGQIDSNVIVGQRNTLNDLGTADNTVINNGGAENVYGQDNSAQVYDGGSQFVLAGGTATGATMYDPGVQVVSSGGLAVDATLSGGEQDVYGAAVGTSVDSAGRQIVESGGVASGTVISAGGTEYVALGGTAAGITFGDTSATLDLESPSGLSGTVSNWQVGDTIDFVSTSIIGASINSATLTVVASGGQNYQYQLSGQQSGTDPGLIPDGSGGTDLLLFQASQLVSGALTVTSGDSVSGIIVVSGGDLILAGGTAVATTVSSGGVETISSGGTENGGIIDDGGVQYVLVGGTASGTIVNDPGLEIVSAGGASTSATLNGGEQDVFGNASFTMINSGGLQVVESGGVGFASLVNGGTMNALAGGTAHDFLVASGTVNIAGLVTSHGNMLGGVENVLSGGVVSGAPGQGPGWALLNGNLVGVGATLNVSAGGSAAFLDVVGTVNVLSGGIATNFTDRISGTTNVSAGGSAHDFTVSSGGTANILAGGTAHDLQVAGSGTLNVLGTLTSNIAVSSGGALTVSSGGAANGVTVGSGGSAFVLSSGLASAATVNSGGSLTVSAGGATSSGALAGGAEFINSGGTDTGTRISSGSVLIVAGAGAVTNDVVAGGHLGLLGFGPGSGGLALGTVVSGGTLDVLVGSIASNTIVRFGGSETVGSGNAFGTVVSSGGFEIVRAGGKDFGTTISSGGFEVVSSGGLAYSASVIGSGNFGLFGGNLSIQGGTASGTVISSGGQETVGSGGTESGATVLVGGIVNVLAGGSIISATLIGSGILGGVEFVSGVASSTLVSSGGHENVVSGGTESGAIVFAGGLVNVTSGGSTTSVTLGGPGVVSAVGTLFGGAVEDLFGGTASGTTILNAGELIVGSGGHAPQAIVDSGGALYVSSGGFAGFTLINSGGSEYVTSGGSGISPIVSSGGTLNVSAGGTALSPTIENGGSEVVSAGGTTFLPDIAGGTLELQAGSVVGPGLISFAGPHGTLKIDGVSIPANILGGFGLGDTVDLAGVPFVSGGSATLHVQNVLRVVEGGQTYNVNLDPAHDYTGQHFQVTSDTNGSTDVSLVDTIPPVLTPVANQTDEATGPNGAVATFTATATDIVDGTDPVVFSEGNKVVHSGDAFALGTHTITASATDAAGNTASETFAIKVQDTTPPTLSSDTNRTVEATGPNGAIVSFPSPTATDIVDGADPVICTPPSGSTFSLGTTTVVARATDAAGNTATETFTVTVVDTTPPTLTPIANQTDEATGPNGAVATFTATATDIVDGTDPVVFTEGNKVVHSGDTFALGTHTIMVSATDAAGNTSSETFTIKVQDTTPPTLSPVANLTVEATGPNGAVVNYPTPTATDIVDGADPVSVNPASGSTFSLGKTTVVASATDAAGNTATETVTVTVVDTTPPTLTPIANQTDEATGPNGAVATFTATATDIVDGTDPVVFTEGNKVVHSGDTFALGTHTIMVSATDAAGNTSSESFTIKVQDTIPPTQTPIANQTDEATGSNGAVATFSATANDIVDGTDPVVFTEGNKVVHSGDTFALGTHTITASATDGAGNTTSETFTFKVQDTTPPTLSPVANLTVEATGPNGAIVSFPSPTATDIVDGADPVFSTPPSGTTFSLGAHAVTVTATDAAGNIATESFTVTVVDTTPPTLTPIADETIEATGPSGAVATFSATAADIVDGTDPVVFSEGNKIIHSGDTFSLGSHTITASAADAAGNVASETFTIKVRDTTPPTVAIATAGGLTNQVSQTISGTATDLVAVGATAAIYDNGNAIGTAALSNGGWSTTVTLAGDGPHNIVAEDTDAAGNTGSSTAVAFTLDTVPPIVAIATSGGLTNQATRTLSGTVSTTEAAPGATIALYDNGNEIGTAALTNGGWSSTVTLSGDGPHSIVAEDTDSAGNTGSSTAVAFTLDTTPPTVKSILASPNSGDLNTGAIVTLTLTMSETVNVVGRPVLTLNDGGTAIYESGAGTNTLVFASTVANGQNAAALAVTGNNLNGSTVAVTDAAGNEADLSGADVTFSGLGIGATVKSITANPPTGDLGPGKAVTFAVTTSEPVKITGGTPLLMLNDGGTATYKSGSGTNVLTFSYTVGALGSGQNAANLAATGFNPNGATIYDSKLLADSADLTGVTAFTSGPQIDTIAPSITSIVANPSTADLDAGKSVILTVTFSENVNVTGAPYLSLNDGGKANYTAGSGTNSLTFTYVVASGQNTAALNVTGLALNGGSIRDGAGNNAVLTGAGNSLAAGLQIDTTPPAVTERLVSDTGVSSSDKITNNDALTGGGDPNAVVQFIVDGTAIATTATADTTGKWTFTPTGLADGPHTIVARETDAAGNTGTASLTFTLDTTAPKATGIVANSASGDLDAGKTVALTVTFDTPVYVTGTPYLTLNDGGRATYASGAGTDVLTFNYSVGAGQNTAALAVTGYAGTLRDVAGNPADISAVIGTLGGPLQIDTTPPKVVSVATAGQGITAGSGDLGPGSTVTFTVSFSENVDVDTTGGTPSLALNDGSTASFAAGSGTSTLLFTYTVGALGSGQNTADLRLAASNAFALNGASITDTAGNAAVLTAANGYNPAGTLQIDTTAPTVTKVVSSVTSGEVTTGHSIRITLDTSEKVSITGAPVLLLNDGGIASYDPVHSTATALAFNYTVASSDVTTDLVVSGIELPSTASIQDLAGNDANLAGAGANLGLQINTKNTGTAGPSGGNLSISGTQDLELFGPSLASVAFGAGSTGTLKLDNSAAFAGTVSGLALGNYLDLADLPFHGNTTPQYQANGSNTGGTLGVTEGANTVNLALLGSYFAGSFVASSDGHGGTLVTDPPLGQQAPVHLSQP